MILITVSISLYDFIVIMYYIIKNPIVDRETVYIVFSSILFLFIGIYGSYNLIYNYNPNIFLYYFDGVLGLHLAKLHLVRSHKEN